MVLRIAKIADTLSRMRVASVKRLIRIFTADISDSHFDELFGPFLEGVKAFVQRTQYADARRRLQNALRSSRPEVAKEFTNYVMNDLAGSDVKFMTMETEALRNKWQGQTSLVDKANKTQVVSDNAIRAGRDLASWVDLINGKYDDQIEGAVRNSVFKSQNKVMEKLEKQGWGAPEEVISEPELLQSIFDQYSQLLHNVLPPKNPNQETEAETKTRQKRKETLDEMNSANQFVKGIEKILPLKTWTTFRKEEKKNVEHRVMPEKADPNIHPIEQLESDTETKDRFKKNVMNNLSKEQGPAAKNLAEVGGKMVDAIFEKGVESMSKFNLVEFMREEKEALELAGLYDEFYTQKDEDREQKKPEGERDEKIEAGALVLDKDGNKEVASDTTAKGRLDTILKKIREYAPKQLAKTAKEMGIDVWMRS